MKPDEIAKCIPDEVVEALKDAANQWAMWLTDEEVRAAIASGLAAWPGAVKFTPHTAKWPEKPSLILPLKENTDGK